MWKNWWKIENYKEGDPEDNQLSKEEWISITCSNKTNPKLKWLMKIEQKSLDITCIRKTVIFLVIVILSDKFS